jgi:hypothetical protein
MKKGYIKVNICEDEWYPVYAPEAAINGYYEIPENVYNEIIAIHKRFAELNDKLGEMKLKKDLKK